MDEISPSNKDLQKELAYYKKQLDRIAGESIRNDFVLSSVRNQLKQKKEALEILTNLQKEFSVTAPLNIIFAQTVKAITTQLRMDRSIALLPVPGTNTFQAGFWYGFSEEEIAMLKAGEIELKADLLKSGQFLLINKSIPPNALCKQIQQTFLLNYFIGVPLLVDEKPIAFIMSGRQYEKVPFILPLDKGDTDTLMAIAGLISTVMQNKKMMELKLQKIEVEKQNEAITEQRDILKDTLAELRNTQALLIQREKMASLGELTAGIAHEIQNPLNFVNNFSEVNTELIEEAGQEIDKGNIDEVKTILNDIKENEQKITHHGKRADAIVKGMLQHSQTSTGQKELSDINKLADDYLHLSYQGIRAKDKTFNTTLKTDFDESIGNIHIIPQDIGRVLLNFYNNAFYAVTEKKKQQSDGYEPIVSVSTKKLNGKVLISVNDNGNGISQKIIDKIFQPFFTTKPTGRGTGLGLSLSYDIIKAHGGEIKVETKEGEGAQFIIQLSIV